MQGGVAARHVDRVAGDEWRLTDLETAREPPDLSTARRIECIHIGVETRGDNQPTRHRNRRSLAMPGGKPPDLTTGRGIESVDVGIAAADEHHAFADCRSVPDRGTGWKPPQFTTGGRIERVDVGIATRDVDHAIDHSR